MGNATRVPAGVSQAKTGSKDVERDVSETLTFLTGTFYPQPLGLRGRLTSLSGSLMVHGAIIGLMILIPGRGIDDQIYVENKKQYNIRWLHLEVPATQPKLTTPSAAKTSAQTAKAPGMDSLKPPGINDTTANPFSPAAALPRLEPPPKPAAKRFELPILKRPKAEQTLVQLDAPPDAVRLPNMPLPTAVLWQQKNLKAAEFKIAAPFQPPVIRRNTPAVPSIEAPNTELVAGNVQLASILVNMQPKLTQMAAVSAPVRTPSPDPGNQPPQTGLPSAPTAALPNLVSLPETPVLAREVVIVPPANQVDPSTMGGAGTRGSGTSTNPVMPDGSGSVAGNNGKDTGNANHSADNASNANSNTGSSKDGPEIIRFDRDGRFSAVVMGSSPTGRYPESFGALSGKILYTVYVQVGLRKNWILQYGLPKSAERNNATRGSTAALDAPWPLIISRPNQNALLDDDYIIVRGVLNPNGRLDNLAMVIPELYPGKELLLSTLRIWEFRPARLDGKDTQIEVLLIVPKQAN